MTGPAQEKLTRDCSCCRKPGVRLLMNPPATPGFTIAFCPTCDTAAPRGTRRAARGES